MSASLLDPPGALIGVDDVDVDPRGHMGGPEAGKFYFVAAKTGDHRLALARVLTTTDWPPTVWPGVRSTWMPSTISASPSTCTTSTSSRRSGKVAVVHGVRVL